eukprot:scaffold11.g4038.t1
MVCSAVNEIAWSPQRVGAFCDAVGAGLRLLPVLVELERWRSAAAPASRGGQQASQGSPYTLLANVIVNIWWRGGVPMCSYLHAQHHSARESLRRASTAAERAAAAEQARRLADDADALRPAARRLHTTSCRLAHFAAAAPPARRAVLGKLEDLWLSLASGLYLAHSAVRACEETLHVSQRGAEGGHAPPPRGVGVEFAEAVLAIAGSAGLRGALPVLHASITNLLLTASMVLEHAVGAPALAAALASSDVLHVVLTAAQLGAAAPTTPFPLPDGVEQHDDKHERAQDSVLEPAREVASCLQAFWARPEQQEAIQLELAAEAALRSCAYLRCSNLGVEGGAAAGEGAGSKKCGACRVVWYWVDGPGRLRLTYNPDGSLATVSGLAPSLFRLDPLGGIDFASPLLDINVATTVEHSVTERCTSCGCGPQHSQLSRRLGLQKGQVIGAGLGAAACGALGVLAGRLGYIAGAALCGAVIMRQLHPALRASLSNN